MSVLVGSFCAWGMVGPWAAARGWVTGDPLSMKGGARGLLLWPGVTMMAVDSLMQLALATVCRPRRRRKVGGDSSTSRAGGDQAADQVDLRRRRRRGFEQGPAPRRRRRRRRRARAAQVPGRPAKVQADARGLGGYRGRERARRRRPPAVTHRRRLQGGPPGRDTPVVVDRRSRRHRGVDRVGAPPQLRHGPLAADPGAPGGGCDVVRRRSVHRVRRISTRSVRWVRSSSSCSRSWRPGRS